MLESISQRTSGGPPMLWNRRTLLAVPWLAAFFPIRARGRGDEAAEIEAVQAIARQAWDRAVEVLQQRPLPAPGDARDDFRDAALKSSWASRPTTSSSSPTAASSSSRRAKAHRRDPGQRERLQRLHRGAAGGGPVDRPVRPRQQPFGHVRRPRLGTGAGQRAGQHLRADARSDAPVDLQLRPAGPRRRRAPGGQRGVGLLRRVAAARWPGQDRRGQRRAPRGLEDPVPAPRQGEGVWSQSRTF